jgi:integrase
MQSEVAHGAGYALGIAALWATGCRPAELAKGIDVDRKGQYWEFIIPGAKTGLTGGVAGKAERGQKFRKIAIRDNGELWCKVLAAAYEKQNGLTIKTSSADTLATQIRRLAKREFGPLHSSRLPSAYSFRHALVRDLKTQHEDVETIAMVLGHASCQSQTKYGRWRKGGGSKAPLAIQATSTVRPRGAKEKKNNTSGLGRFKAASAIKSAMRKKAGIGRP